MPDRDWPSRADSITSSLGGSEQDFSCHLIKLVFGSSETSDSDRAAFLPESWLPRFPVSLTRSPPSCPACLFLSRPQGWIRGRKGKRSYCRARGLLPLPGPARGPGRAAQRVCVRARRPVSVRSPVHGCDGV